MGQNARKICTASDYVGSEILKVFKQISGNKNLNLFLLGRWNYCQTATWMSGKGLRTLEFWHVCVSVTTIQSLKCVCIRQGQEADFSPPFRFFLVFISWPQMVTGSQAGVEWFISCIWGSSAVDTSPFYFYLLLIFLLARQSALLVVPSICSASNTWKIPGKNLGA